MRKNKVFYSLSVEDIQTVATETFGRELSDDEIKKIIEPIGDSISWYEIIEYAIRDILELPYHEEE